MPSSPVISRTVGASSLAPLAQYVPGRVCATCDVCCHFPEAESFLRPYFTQAEADRAVTRGLPRASFPEGMGQVALVPSPDGEGYLCPAYDTQSHGCGIYADRPLDCQIYPFALMWDAQHEQVLLGWDTKCPYVSEGEAAIPSALIAHAEVVAAALEREPQVDIVADNPSLITRYQDDVVIVRALPALSARLRPRPAADGLQPLTPADRLAFEAAAAAAVVEPGAEWARPSSWLWANHWLWRDRLDYSWKEIRGCWCLFAETSDGLFMPAVPLGGPLDRHVVAEVFELMRTRARGEGVARIQQVPMAWAEQWTGWGYRAVPAEPEFVYQAGDLTALKGDRYKSPRAACNRLVREHQVSIAPYHESDREACWALFEEWRAQKMRAIQQDRESGDWAALLLEDSVLFHQRLLAECALLDLKGWVAKVDGRIRAYTFGGALSSDLWCVLAEITDRSITGLSEWIFREGARCVADAGFRWINTMDATGLPSLARAKEAYHPWQRVPLATIYES